MHPALASLPAPAGQTGPSLHMRALAALAAALGGWPWLVGEKERKGE